MGPHTRMSKGSARFDSDFAIIYLQNNGCRQCSERTRANMRFNFYLIICRLKYFQIIDILKIHGSEVITVARRKIHPAVQEILKRQQCNQYFPD